MEKDEARVWYVNEAADQNWSTRALERQINSLYYERLKMSRDKSTVIKEMQEKTALIPAKPQDFIKDPYVLEFLGTEKDETVAKYSVLKENKRLFASKYKLYLPTEKELIRRSRGRRR